MNDYQLFRVKNLLSGYMMGRYLNKLCPFDSNTVGVEIAFGLKVHSANIEWEELSNQEKDNLYKMARMDLES